MQLEKSSLTIDNWISTVHNSTFAIGGVSCSVDNFVVADITLDCLRIEDVNLFLLKIPFDLCGQLIPSCPKLNV